MIMENGLLLEFSFLKQPDHNDILYTEQSNRLCTYKGIEEKINRDTNCPHKSDEGFFTPPRW